MSPATVTVELPGKVTFEAEIVPDAAEYAPALEYMARQLARGAAVRVRSRFENGALQLTVELRSREQVAADNPAKPAADSEGAKS